MTIKGNLVLSVAKNGFQLIATSKYDVIRIGQDLNAVSLCWIANCSYARNSYRITKKSRRGTADKMEYHYWIIPLVVYSL